MKQPAYPPLCFEKGGRCTHGRLCRLPWGHTGAHQGVCILCTTPRALKVAQRQVGDYSKKPRPTICTKKKEKGVNKYKGSHR